MKCRHCGFSKEEHIEGLWCAKYESLEEVVGEFEDNNEGFRWRLKCGDETSRWYSDYQGILTHEFNGRLYGLCSQYWEGTLPCEQPFEINAKPLTSHEMISKAQRTLFEARESVRDTIDDSTDSRFMRLCAEIGTLAEDFRPLVHDGTCQCQDCPEQYGYTCPTKGE